MQENVDKSEYIYRHYRSELSRKELVEHVSIVAEYMHAEGISNIMLLDRSARPFYVGLWEYWHNKYPQEQVPAVYFTNPAGFKRNLLNMRFKGSILKDVNNTYAHLAENKDQPLLIFDVCLHTGDSIRPVIEMLEQSGFKNVRVGIVDTSDTEKKVSDIKIDLKISTEEPVRSCYTFDRNNTVVKERGSVIGTPNPGVNRAYKSSLYSEIRRIIKEHFNE